jgi:soluble lytic murein transglycosylase
MCLKQVKTGLHIDLNPFFFSLISILTLGISVSISSALADEINCEWLINEPIKETPKERYRKGYCSIRLGRFNEGLTLLNGLEKELPLIADYVLYYRGVGEKGLGKASDAAGLFNRILTEYPESGLRKRALTGLAETYSNTGDYQKAETIYRSLYVIEEDPKEKAAFLNRIAESLEKQGRYLEAIKAYKELWVEFPESPYADAAINRALRIGNAQGIPLVTTESDYLQRAERLFKLYRWESAIKDFERVSKTDDVKLKIAISKFRLGLLNEALDLLIQISSPESLYWRARVSAKLGRDDEASETYYRIYLLYPQSPLAPEALYNAARLYQINSDFERALNLYDLLIRRYPGSEFTEDGAWNLGWIYYRRGMYREALATFSASASSGSSYNSSRAAYWKAKTLEKQGNRGEAFAVYESLSRSTFPSYYSYLARKKTGFTPNLRPVSQPSTKVVASNPRRERAELLIELGIFEDAYLEIERLREESKSDEELLSVSELYAKANDFYDSIRIAEGLGLSQANTLSYPRGFSEIVKGYSVKYNVDEFLVYSIIREESRFQKYAVSPSGAIGLMQLIPDTGRSTAKEAGISGYNTDMLYVPRINIELGIAYFKKVLEEFGGNVHLAIASYNAGPYNVASWLLKLSGLDPDEFVEEIPFQETRNYVRRVLRSYGVYKALYDNEFF